MSKLTVSLEAILKRYRYHKIRSDQLNSLFWGILIDQLASSPKVLRGIFKEIERGKIRKVKS